MKTIWYISKYVSIPKASSTGPGERGFALMRELANGGFDVNLISSDSNPLSEVDAARQIYSQEVVDNVKVHQIRTLKYTKAKSISRLLSWVDFELKLFFMPKTRLDKPDVVIISSLSLLTILNGILLKYFFKCRLAFEIRDIWPLTLVEEGGFSKYNPFILFFGLLEKVGYKFSDVIVGTMPNLSEHVENILGYKREVYCIPMGIDPNLKAQPWAEKKNYLDKYIPKDKFIIGYAGTIGTTNALETLFETASALQSHPNLHFVIIGDGNLKYHFQEKYKSLANISFAPKVQKNQLHEILLECDVLFFSVHKSSVWKYGQSLNKLTDYMLAGKPVIASYSGYESMINEANCGVFVPAGNVSKLSSEILKFSKKSNHELKEMGAQGFEWIIAERNYKSLADEYSKILFS